MNTHMMMPKLFVLRMVQKLASIKNMQESHHSGGEWCSYGWSDNQMALFPTQDATYKKLQTIPGHENDCGRPGINGGYIENPNVRFE